MDKFFTAFGKIILILLVVGGVGYATYTYSKISVTQTPQTNQGETTTVPSTNPVIPTPTPQPLQTVTAGLNHSGGISFPGYTILVPAGWTVNHQGTSGASPSDTLTLTNSGYQIKIYQAATGGAPCLYPGDPDQEGPSSRFTSFIEFMGSNNNTFRRSSSSNSTEASTGYTLCMKGNGNTTFGQPTGFGHISYTAPSNNPDESVLSRMDVMIASLHAQ